MPNGIGFAFLSSFSDLNKFLGPQALVRYAASEGWGQQKLGCVFCLVRLPYPNTNVVVHAHFQLLVHHPNVAIWYISSFYVYCSLYLCCGAHCHED